MNTQQDSASTSAARSREHAIYKPNKRGSGGVVRFELNRAKECIFVEAARQSGPKQFDWEHKLIMKWGMADIGEALAVLGGRSPAAKMFHKTEGANSTFELASGSDPERAPYRFSLSRQNSASGEVRRISVPLTHAEAATLETLLRAAVVRLMRW